MISRSILVSIALIISALLPTPAWADNCGSLSDCFSGNLIPAILLVLGIALLVVAWPAIAPILARLAAAAALRFMVTTTTAATIAQRLAQMRGKGLFNFRTPQLYASHFLKHINEFGYTSMRQYLEGARRLFQGGPNIKTIHEWTSRGGPGGTLDRIFYDVVTKEYGVLSHDGYIRSYYVATEGLQRFMERVLSL